MDEFCCGIVGIFVDNQVVESGDKFKVILVLLLFVFGFVFVFVVFKC